MPGAEVDVSGGGRAAFSLNADANGAFKIQLAPGSYTVQAHNVGGYHSTTSQTVVVGTSGITVVLTVDSGIR